MLDDVQRHHLDDVSGNKDTDISFEEEGEAYGLCDQQQLKNRCRQVIIPERRTSPRKIHEHVTFPRHTC